MNMDLSGGCPMNTCLTNIGRPWNGEIDGPEVIMAPCGLVNRPEGAKPSSQKWTLKDVEPNGNLADLITGGAPVFQIISMRGDKCVAPSSGCRSGDLVMVDCDGPRAFRTYWMGFTGCGDMCYFPMGPGSEVNLGCWADEGELVALMPRGESGCASSSLVQIREEILNGVRKFGSLPPPPLGD
uniref:Uncharacterized protein n=1 Tax=Odontella aurita TaxID=265563 RepID=A0A6U6C9P3_9STRA|mmetsp:Transcript_11412/g.33635  ORF Transcript_11412/g.33635 Transcript_11412/m.33635 type:complete len:183 (+) Transcript_11412:1144-1692(+)